MLVSVGAGFSLLVAHTVRELQHCLQNGYLSNVRTAIDSPNSSHAHS